jgi:hypothetical protein
LIHGWGGSSKSEGWFSWLKIELKKRKIKIIVFDMPDTENPIIKDWVGFLRDNVKELNKETYFIGHSIGCQGVLRYLETLDPKIKIKGCVFVAPWMELDKNTIKEEGEEVVQVAKPWIETPINWEKVKSHTDNFLCILSDNDPYVPLSNKEIFQKKLGAKVIILKAKEHFNEVEKIEQVLDFIEK